MDSGRNQAANGLWGVLKRVFDRKSNTGETARRRLQLVLVHDRASLSPSTISALKDDLISVVSKYVDIDRDSVQVEMHRSGTSLVLVSNIRIGGIERETA